MYGNCLFMSDKYPNHATFSPSKSSEDTEWSKIDVSVPLSMIWVPLFVISPFFSLLCFPFSLFAFSFFALPCFALLRSGFLCCTCCAFARFALIWCVPGPQGRDDGGEEEATQDGTRHPKGGPSLHRQVQVNWLQLLYSKCCSSCAGKRIPSTTISVCSNEGSKCRILNHFVCVLCGRFDA